MGRRLGILGLFLLGGTSAWIVAQPPGGGPGGPPRGEGMPPHPLVEALDLDKDGTISAEELQKASESLKKLDKNGDGKLTRDEYSPARGSRPGMGKGGPDGKKGGSGKGGEGKGKGEGKGEGKGPPGGPGGPGGDRPPFEDSDKKKMSKAETGANPLPEAIAWYTDLFAGLDEAKRTGKPILLMSAAPSCGGVPGMW